jgi:hypothetical protein
MSHLGTEAVPPLVLESDASDCEWARELHSVGLLRGSFRPAPAIAALRAPLRHRETLVQNAATHIQRMQKALVQMNLPLHLVVSDIMGVTGLKILRDMTHGAFRARRRVGRWRHRRSQRVLAISLDTPACTTGKGPRP